MAPGSDASILKEFPDKDRFHWSDITPLVIETCATYADSVD